MLARAILATLALLAPFGALAGPERVVSMNLCTDQLAMMVGPEQLISVSYLAHDPRSSAMTEEAAAYPANRGLAEEVFLLEPDLVIAGTFTTRATVDMLTRLGIRVVEFAPANNLEDVRDRIRRMGDLMERADRAEALITRFDADLAALQTTGDLRPRAATYYANGYTSGTGTLADSVIEAAGLANTADEAGLAGGGYLALESLVMADPDLLITGRPFDNPALADTVLAHPALAAIQAEAGAAPVADRDWVCGTPHVIAAIRRLAAARDAVLPK